MFTRVLLDQNPHWPTAAQHWIGPATPVPKGSNPRVPPGWLTEHELCTLDYVLTLQSSQQLHCHTSAIWTFWNDMLRFVWDSRADSTSPACLDVNVATSGTQSSLIALYSDSLRYLILRVCVGLRAKVWLGFHCLVIMSSYLVIVDSSTICSTDRYLVLRHNLLPLLWSCLCKKTARIKPWRMNEAFCCLIF